MKKITFVCTLLCVSLTASAQWTGGLKVGLNLSQQKWDVSVDIPGVGSNSDTQKLKGTGFHVGGYLTKMIKENISFQPELMYSQIKVDDEDTELTLNYISLPVLFGYGVESNKLFFQAGPQLGLLLSSDPSEMKEDEYMKSIDFSFVLGMSLNLDKLNFGARYVFGITNIVQPKLINETEAELETLFGPVDLDMSIKNNYFQLSVGYKLF
ncbi:MAG TPA: porin family protein [Cyclobacteriaceae bacterium]|nr:porin family protein [Cyclobacteriaceae bacterium]